MVLTRIDHVSTGLSLLISQYKDKPVIAALLTSYLERVQAIEDATIDVEANVLNLDDAVGEQLEICGSILDEPRVGAPDAIYRRRLKAKVRVLKSGGRVSDFDGVLRNFQGLFEPGTTTNDDSDVYIIIPDAWDGTSFIPENKGVEIHIIPERDNTYNDPQPFDPKGNHDQLLKAKAAGEELQTVWAMVNFGENPSTDSLRLTNNISSSVPNGFGSTYVTDSAGFSTMGGGMAHRRKDFSQFADIGEQVNIFAPSIAATNLFVLSGTFTISTGTWYGLPTTFEYTLRRNGTPIPGASSVTLAEAQAYQITAEDVSGSISVDEIAIRNDFTVTASSGELHGPNLWTTDPNLVFWFSFDDISGTVANEVEVLNNKVGTADALIATGSSITPILIEEAGKPAGHFDGSGNYMYLQTATSMLGVTMSQPTEVSWFGTLGNITGDSYFWGTFDAAGSHSNSLFMNTSFEAEAYAGSSLTAAAPPAPIFAQQTGSFWVRFNQGDSFIWTQDFRSGSAAANPADGVVGSQDWVAFVLGSSFNSITSSALSPFTGSVNEIAVRTGSLEDSAREKYRQSWAKYIEITYSASVAYDNVVA